MNPQTPLNPEIIITNPYMTPKATKPPEYPPPLKKYKNDNVSHVDINYLRLLTIFMFQEQK